MATSALSVLDRDQLLEGSVGSSLCETKLYKTELQKRLQTNQKETGKTE